MEFAVTLFSVMSVGTIQTISSIKVFRRVDKMGCASSRCALKQFFEVLHKFTFDWKQPSDEVKGLYKEEDDIDCE